ncbi:MAG TPA: ATP-binding protein [Candidatus Onthovivens sp.]|nr:ATP-binding protein [Candidatus Onthovivens sp.]
MKAIRIILACIRKADKDFNFIENNDKIVLGISGGKDSMALLYALHLYKKFSINKFEIYPVMVNLGFPNFDPSKIQEFTRSLGYELEIVDSSHVFGILKTYQDNNQTPLLPCSICSKMKKAIINKAAHNLNVNKVSFAHHKNDAIETLFLNQIYGGRIATFSPKMYLSHEKISFIRPLVYCNEKDIIRLVKEEKITVMGSSCPNDKFTKRQDIKEITNQIVEKFPSSEENFLTMLNNKEKLDLFFDHFDHKIDKKNLSYKEIISIKDYIEVKNYIKDLKLTKSEAVYQIFKLLKRGKLEGVFYILQTNRDFVIETYKIKDPQNLKFFLLDFYFEIYQKYNPTTLLVYVNNEDLEKLSGLDYIIKRKLKSKTLISFNYNPKNALKELIL